MRQVVGSLGRRLDHGIDGASDLLVSKIIVRPPAVKQIYIYESERLWMLSSCRWEAPKVPERMRRCSLP